jgi:hypothetical protein
MSHYGPVMALGAGHSVPHQARDAEFIGGNSQIV